MKRSVIPVFIPHLGCEHRCVFCDQRTSAAHRAPSPGEVRDEVGRALAAAGPDVRPQIAFYGGSFTALPAEMQERYLEAVQEFLDRGAAENIRLSTRPDATDRETLDRLVRYRVGTVELGVQSLSDEVLRRSGRGHTAGAVHEAVRLIRETGLELVLQIMPGLPGADRAEMLATAAGVRDLAPDAVRVYPVCVIRGTPLEEMMRAGEYVPLTVEDAVEVCAEICELFDGAGIPVIRVGLNPTAELSGGGVVAGAYHPAFGERVKSEQLRRRVCALLEEAPPGAVGVSVTVPRGRLSQLRGQRNSNVVVFRGRFPGLEIRLGECEQEEPVAVRWTVGPEGGQAEGP